MNTQDETIADQLQRHIARWNDETQHSSRVVTEHPSYQAIVAMGKSVLPALFREMSHRPDWFFVALEEITGAQPERLPEHAGRLDELTQDWLEWAKAHGYF